MVARAGALALAFAGAVACGSGGGVTAGGTCFRATDCAAGLYCCGPGPQCSNIGTKPGTCTSNVDKAQPPAGDAAFPDGGQVMGLDGPVLDVPNVPDTSAPADTGGPPMDTGGPVDTGGPMDSGPPKDASKKG